MEWFVFEDTAYYPSVLNKHEKDEDGIYRYLPVVADTPEEAMLAVGSRPGKDEEIYVCPWDQVTVFKGPATTYPVEKASLLPPGHYNIRVEGGSIRPAS